jgi:hypothetical protein
MKVKILGSVLVSTPGWSPFIRDLPFWLGVI